MGNRSVTEAVVAGVVVDMVVVAVGALAAVSNKKGRCCVLLADVDLIHPTRPHPPV